MDEPGLTPLHKAALQGDTATIAALLDAGADPNARTWFGRTPLYFAAAAGHTAAVAALRAERVGSTKPDHLSGRAFERESMGDREKKISCAARRIIVRQCGVWTRRCSIRQSPGQLGSGEEGAQSPEFGL